MLLLWEKGHFARGSAAPGPGPPPGQAAEKNSSSVTNVHACDNNEFINLLSVNPVHAYHLTGAQFMLDTSIGAAVILL